MTDTARSQRSTRTRITTQQSRRAVVSGTLGSVVEWFDFAVYGALSATIFPHLFFDDLGETGALLASFASFGVGFVARPLGGILFGHLGDRLGRRPVLLATFLIMGISSTLIGILPGGQGLGIAAILVLLRFIQGFSLGGEATGSQLMTMEHSRIRHRGVLGALINMGSPLANLVANLVLVVLTTTLSDEAWIAWGWRVPFLASLLLVAIGIYIRLKLEETPAFTVTQELRAAEEVPKTSGLSVLKRHPGRLVQLIIAFGGISMTYNLLITYGLTFVQEHVHEGSPFIALSIANLFAFVMCVVGGFVSDRIGRKPVFLIGAAGCLVGTLAFFPIATAGSFAGSVVAMTVAACGVQFAFGAQPALWAEQFPTPTRFAGSALSYTMSNVIFAAPTPFVATLLTSMSGGSTIPVSILVTVVLIMTFVAVWTIREHKGIDLAAYTDESYITELEARA